MPFSVFPSSPPGGSNAAQIWQVVIDDTTLFATESAILPDEGAVDFPVLLLDVPAETELVKLRWSVTGAHPQAGDFAYFTPRLKVNKAIKANYEFSSTAYGEVQPWLWVFDGAGALEAWTPNQLFGFQYNWQLDAAYEEVKTFIDGAGGGSLVGGINKFPNAPSVKGTVHFKEQPLTAGTVLFKGYGRAPNVAVLRSNTANVSMLVAGGNCTLKLSAANLAEVASASIELDFTPGLRSRVTARPDEGWADGAFVDEVSGVQLNSFVADTVFTLEVVSADAGATGFGSIGFMGGETSAQFDV